MKNLKSILGVLMLAFVAVSCSDNDTQIVEPVASKTITNLHAPANGQGSYTGEFSKFSFKTGTTVTDDSWDIAFRATEIIVNGGVKGKLLEDIDRVGNASMTLLTGTFKSITEVPTDTELKQDSAEALVIATGSNNGWYTYVGPPTHAINPITGKVIVVKTIDGNYAKMEIRSYYKNEDITSESRYFTFDYVYNPTVGDKNLK